VMMMFRGGEVAVGPSDSLLQADTLSRLYGYEIERFEVDGKTVFIPA